MKQPSKEEEAQRHRQQARRLLVVLLCGLVAVVLVGRSAFYPQPVPAARVQLAIGDRFCGNASNYFSPFEWSIAQCRDNTTRPPDARQLGMILERYPCSLCPENTTECTPRTCVPRHLKGSEDSAVTLAMMAASWCALITRLGPEEAMNMTVSATGLAEWRHALYPSDVAASYLEMLPTGHPDGVFCNISRERYLGAWA